MKARRREGENSFAGGQWAFQDSSMCLHGMNLACILQVHGLWTERVFFLF